MEKKPSKFNLLIFKDENWSQETEQFAMSHSLVGALIPLHFSMTSWETK